MSGSRRNPWALALQAAGTCLLAAAVALEITDEPLPTELALSLAAATPYLAVAPLYTAGRRTWMVVAAAIALMLAVASLVRITEQPLVNALHVLPLLLVAYTASTVRSATHRDRSLQRARVRARHDGAERERRRWARELHDDTLQELGAVQVVLSSAAADGRPEAMRGAIDQARSLVGNQITSLRHLITDLRPLVLDELGLRAALDALSPAHLGDLRCPRRSPDRSAGRRHRRPADLGSTGPCVPHRAGGADQRGETRPAHQDHGHHGGRSPRGDADRCRQRARNAPAPGLQTLVSSARGHPGPRRARRGTLSHARARRPDRRPAHAPQRSREGHHHHPASAPCADLSRSSRADTRRIPSA